MRAAGKCRLLIPEIIGKAPEAPQFYIDPDICIEYEQCVVVCSVWPWPAQHSLTRSSCAFDNFDINDGLHPKNIRGKLGKVMNHWYTKGSTHETGKSTR